MNVQKFVARVLGREVLGWLKSSQTPLECAADAAVELAKESWPSCFLDTLRHRLRRLLSEVVRTQELVHEFLSEQEEDSGSEQQDVPVVLPFKAKDSPNDTA